ncbi:MAG: radical SAM protein [Clostridia bacterium]|nr:radical SAM protein [Clostridia bacterium]
MYSRVYVEITNICNMNCSFCHGHSRPAKRMSKDEFCAILQKLQGQTEYLYYHLMGEPLTHPELPDFLQLATEKGYRSVITTNGTLLNKVGQQIITAKPHKVNISLHSFEQNDGVDFDAYLSQVADFADAASKAGIIICLRLWNKGGDEGKNLKVLDFLRTHIDGDWSLNTRGMRIREKLHLEWGDRFSWPDKSAPIQSDKVFCYGLKDHFGILCDGTVVPCCLDSEGVINLGNVFEQDIEQILGSPRAKAMAEGFRCRKATEDLCRRCGYATRFN